MVINIAYLLVGLVLLSLAVKQLSYALAKGSLFEPLRQSIRDAMLDGVFGMKTINELFTCRLCMTMQVSVWVVMVPVFILCHYTDPVSGTFSVEAPAAVKLVLHFMGSFLYAFAVSALALKLWNDLEMPVEQFEQMRIDLGAAASRIALLEQENAALRAKKPAPRKRESSVARQPAPPSPEELFPLVELSDLVETMQRQCYGIGCGWSRMACRQQAAYDFTGRWASKHADRTVLQSQLYELMNQYLPDYFRVTSGKGINETALARAYKGILAGLA